MNLWTLTKYPKSSSLRYLLIELIENLFKEVTFKEYKKIKKLKLNILLQFKKKNPKLTKKKIKKKKICF